MPYKLKRKIGPPPKIQLIGFDRGLEPRVENVIMLVTYVNQHLPFYAEIMRGNVPMEMYRSYTSHNVTSNYIAFIYYWHCLYTTRDHISSVLEKGRTLPAAYREALDDMDTLIYDIYQHVYNVCRRAAEPTNRVLGIEALRFLACMGRRSLEHGSYSIAKINADAMHNPSNFSLQFDVYMQTYVVADDAQWNAEFERIFGSDSYSGPRAEDIWNYRFRLIIAANVVSVNYGYDEWLHRMLPAINSALAS